LYFNLLILNKFEIEIAGSSRNGGTPRNDTKGLILLMLPLRAKRSNLLFWTMMIKAERLPVRNDGLMDRYFRIPRFRDEKVTVIKV
jgi:hypothetical protein